MVLLLSLDSTLTASDALSRRGSVISSPVSVSSSSMDSAEMACMLPILRFLQLTCENHNRELQVWNIVQESISF